MENDLQNKKSQTNRFNYILRLVITNKTNFHIYIIKYYL